jgi:1-deoxy-D-xylulose-5-phosphate synthase
MTWEALNNISDDNERNLVIVVNDNGRSYAPTIGGMARYMNRVRTAGVYRDLHRKSDRFFRAFGPVGRAFYRGVRGGTHGFLSRFSNNEELYSNLDIKYLGPIDGHDIPSLLETLQLAKDYGAPVIVHVITEKGRGTARARRRGGSVPRGRQDRPEDRRPLAASGTDGPTCSPTHWSTSVRAPRRSSR